MKKIIYTAIIGCSTLASTNISLANEAFEEKILKRLESLEKELELTRKDNVVLRSRLNRIEGSEAKPSVARVNTKQKALGRDQDPVLDSGAQLASLPDTSNSDNPNLKAYNDRKFELNASFIGLMPSTSNLVYGTAISPYPLPTPNWNDRTITPSFSPTFSIGARWMPSKSNDVDVNWTHLNTTSTASVGINPHEQMIGPTWLIGPTASNYGSGYGKGTFTYDAVNLEAGHTFCADCSFSFRPFGGVEFANLSQSLTGEFSNALGAQNHNKGLNWMSNTTSSGFTGAGPRIGLGGQYNWHDFEFIGKLGAGLLVGVQQSQWNLLTTCTDGCPSQLTYDKSNDRLLSSSGGQIIGNSQAYTTPNTTQVIPTLDAKLATAYAFAPTSQGQFKVELGWRAATYFNTVSQYTVTNVVPAFSLDTPTGIYLASGQHSLNNFTVQGPYITGKWAY